MRRRGAARRCADLDRFGGTPFLTTSFSAALADPPCFLRLKPCSGKLSGRMRELGMRLNPYLSLTLFLTGSAAFGTACLGLWRPVEYFPWLVGRERQVNERLLPAFLVLMVGAGFAARRVVWRIRHRQTAKPTGSGDPH